MSSIVFSAPSKSRTYKVDISIMGGDQNWIEDDMEWMHAGSARDLNSGDTAMSFGIRGPLFHYDLCIIKHLYSPVDYWFGTPVMGGVHEN